MERGHWAHEVRDVLALNGDLRQKRIIGVQSTLVSVDSTLRSIVENPRACDKRGAAAVLRLDAAEIGDALVWASPTDALRLRGLAVRLERFAAHLQGGTERLLAA